MTYPYIALHNLNNQNRLNDQNQSPVKNEIRESEAFQSTGGIGSECSLEDGSLSPEARLVVRLEAIVLPILAEVMQEPITDPEREYEFTGSYQDFDLEEQLSERFGLEIDIENDLEAMGVDESGPHQRDNYYYYMTVWRKHGFTPYAAMGNMEDAVVEVTSVRQIVNFLLARGINEESLTSGRG